MSGALPSLSMRGSSLSPSSPLTLSLGPRETKDGLDRKRKRSGTMHHDPIIVDVDNSDAITIHSSASDDECQPSDRHCRPSLTRGLRWYHPSVEEPRRVPISIDDLNRDPDKRKRITIAQVRFVLDYCPPANHSVCKSKWRQFRAECVKEGLSQPFESMEDFLSHNYDDLLRDLITRVCPARISDEDAVSSRFQ
jgi:hypothetical protein